MLRKPRHQAGNSRHHFAPPFPGVDGHPSCRFCRFSVLLGGTQHAAVNSRTGAILPLFKTHNITGTPRGRVPPVHMNEPLACATHCCWACGSKSGAPRAPCTIDISQFHLYVEISRLDRHTSGNFPVPGISLFKKLLHLLRPGKPPTTGFPSGVQVLHVERAKDRHGFPRGHVQYPLQPPGRAGSVSAVRPQELRRANKVDQGQAKARHRGEVPVGLHLSFPRLCRSQTVAATAAMLHLCRRS